MHLDFHVGLGRLVVDGGDAHPQILRQADLAPARMNHSALILARLVEQDEQVRLDRNLEQRAGGGAEFLPDHAPSAALPAMR